MNLLGYDEAEYFQAVHEMPSGWERSVSAWVAVLSAVNRARMLARWYFKNKMFKQCAQSIDDSIRIQKRNGIRYNGIRYNFGGRDGDRWRMR